MILVDTSVLISFLKGEEDDKITILQDILSRDIPFGISCYTYQEVLQGARNEAEFKTLKDYLSSQHIYYLDSKVDTYEKAARLFYNLRRSGVTPRSTLDILIALTAIENNLALLHNDRDFDTMAKRVPELRILHNL